MSFPAPAISWDVLDYLPIFKPSMALSIAVCALNRERAVRPLAKAKNFHLVILHGGDLIDIASHRCSPLTPEDAAIDGYDHAKGCGAARHPGNALRPALAASVAFSCCAMISRGWLERGGHR